MNEERDSQLSAMFDGELSAAECELLARRLAKDEALRGQWSRYALIGAAIRADAGVRLDFRLAERVAAQVAVDDVATESVEERAPAVAVGAAGGAAPARRSNRWFKPVAGVGIAASVAAASILWIRSEPTVAPTLTAANAPTVSADSPAVSAASTAGPSLATTRAPEPMVEFSNGEPASYVVPPVSGAAGSIAPAALANYVVAHSEFSGPLSRRMVLSGLVGNEVPADEAPPVEPAAPTTEAADGGR